MRDYQGGNGLRYPINEHLQQMDPDDLAAALKSAASSKSKALAMLGCDCAVNGDRVDDLVVVFPAT